ncbi:MAG: hypothetical protein H8Z69_01530 [Nanohaloarchaea archaeon]|nr:hypothetical protein [Candidatus Nanohaloarchaea archaeon]
MSMDPLLERSEENLLREDERLLQRDDTKVGEGANTSAHRNHYNQIIKSRPYDPESDDAGMNPSEKENLLKQLDRAVWTDVGKREVDAPFEYMLVRMERGIEHAEAVDRYSPNVDQLVAEDLDMFFDMREEGVTYRDFKPDNIGYFPGDGDCQGFWSDPDSYNWETVVARPIDVMDEGLKREENLSNTEMAKVLDIYIGDVPGEEGIVDLYTVSTEDAERAVLNYLGLDGEVTGDPYMDMRRVFHKEGTIKSN